jgi:ferrous iron transport protein A
MDIATPTPSVMRLDDLGRGRGATVVGVDPATGAGDALPMEARRRLVEIGFVAGERVEVVAAAYPSGDPIAVRIGSTRFALRRVEAQAVRIAPDAG